MAKVARSVGIHDGTFHADEVTACALLLTFGLIDEEKIVRSRDLEKLARCDFVCDVGGRYSPKERLFDHHQADYIGDLSSAGMVLLYLKEERHLSKEEFDYFNNALIKGVDAHDNGRSPQDLGYCSFSHVIANFVPASYEATDAQQTGAFKQALAFTRGHLERMRQRFAYTNACREKVALLMKGQKRALIFDQALPWLESFFALGGKNHPALFVVMPAGEQWKVRGIPPDYEHRMQVRLPLPQEWAGLLEQDLKRVSGIPGAVFCHKGRFTSVWETKRDALAALRIIFEKNGIPYDATFDNAL